MDMANNGPFGSLLVVDDTLDAARSSCTSLVVVTFPAILPVLTYSCIVQYPQTETGLAQHMPAWLCVILLSQ